MIDLGDRQEGATIVIPFSTSLKTGGRVAPSAAIDLADFFIYKSDNIAERTSTAGWTYTETFDSKTGISTLKIDLGDNTDAGFYAVRNDFFCVLYPDSETIDGEAVASIIAVWSIENRPAIGVVPFVCEGTPTATVIQTDLAETDNDIFNGRTIIMLDGPSKKEIGDIEGYVGSSGTLTIATGDLSQTPLVNNIGVVI